MIMAPLYAIVSVVCLAWLEASEYLILFRDCYEAFTIYSFFKLITRMLDGEKATIRFLAGQPQTAHPWGLRRILKPWTMGGVFFYRVKYGVLQYVVAKMVLALLDFTVSMLRLRGWPAYVATGTIYAATNVSQTIALYCLGLFYIAVKEPLQQWNPMPKFLSVKLVVFATWWQSFVGSILVWAKVIHGVAGHSATQVETAWLNYIVCLEMFIVSVWHHRVYPVEEMTQFLKQEGETTPLMGSACHTRRTSSCMPQDTVAQNLRLVLSVADVKSDIAQLFKGKGAVGHRQDFGTLTSMATEAIPAQPAADGSTQPPTARNKWKKGARKAYERMGGRDSLDAAEESESAGLRRSTPHAPTPHAHTSSNQ